MFLDVPAKGAELEIMLETRDGPHADEIVARIEREGFPTRILDAPGGRETGRRN
jgi:threonine dehydratase